MMLIFVDFQELTDIQDHLKRELSVLETLTNSLEFKYQLSQSVMDGNAELFQRQLQFCKKEKDRISGRSKLLQETLEIFSEAKGKLSDNIISAKGLLINNFNV